MPWSFLNSRPPVDDRRLADSQTTSNPHLNPHSASISTSVPPTPPPPPPLGHHELTNQIPSHHHHLNHSNPASNPSLTSSHYNHHHFYPHPSQTLQQAHHPIRSNKKTSISHSTSSPTANHQILNYSKYTQDQLQHPQPDPLHPRSPPKLSTIPSNRSVYSTPSIPPSAQPHPVSLPIHHPEPRRPSANRAQLHHHLSPSSSHPHPQPPPQLIAPHPLRHSRHSLDLIHHPSPDSMASFSPLHPRSPTPPSERHSSLSSQNYYYQPLRPTETESGPSRHSQVLRNASQASFDPHPRPSPRLHSIPIYAQDPAQLSPRQSPRDYPHHLSHERHDQEAIRLQSLHRQELSLQRELREEDALRLHNGSQPNNPSPRNPSNPLSQHPLLRPSPDPSYPSHLAHSSHLTHPSHPVHPSQQSLSQPQPKPSFHAPQHSRRSQVDSSHPSRFPPGSDPRTPSQAHPSHHHPLVFTSGPNSRTHAQGHFSYPLALATDPRTHSTVYPLPSHPSTLTPGSDSRSHPQDHTSQPHLPSRSAMPQSRSNSASHSPAFSHQPDPFFAESQRQNALQAQADAIRQSNQLHQKQLDMQQLHYASRHSSITSTPGNRTSRPNPNSPTQPSQPPSRSHLNESFPHSHQAQTRDLPQASKASRMLLQLSQADRSPLHPQSHIHSFLNSSAPLTKSHNGRLWGRLSLTHFTASLTSPFWFHSTTTSHTISTPVRRQIPTAARSNSYKPPTEYSRRSTDVGKTFSHSSNRFGLPFRSSSSSTPASSCATRKQSTCFIRQPTCFRISLPS